MKNDRLKRLMAGVFAFTVMSTSVFSTNRFKVYADTDDFKVDLNKVHSLNKEAKKLQDVEKEVLMKQGLSLIHILRCFLRYYSFLLLYF